MIRLPPKLNFESDWMVGDECPLNGSDDLRVRNNSIYTYMHIMGI